MSYLYVIIQILMIVVIGVTGPISLQIYLGGAVMGVWTHDLVAVDHAAVGVARM
jgi:hypothetical protein